MSDKYDFSNIRKEQSARILSCYKEMDINKGDIAYAFSGSNNTLEFNKKGEEFKKIVSEKKNIIDTQYNTIEAQKNNLKSQLKEEEVEFRKNSDGYEYPVYNDNYSDDTRAIISQYSNLNYACQRLNDELKVLNTLYENIDDKKTYTLTLKQLTELQKAEEVDIEKAEGSRGGKVIGHTKNGKPIYEHSGKAVKHKVGDSVVDKEGNKGKVTHSDDEEIAVEHENGDVSGYTHDQVKKVDSKKDIKKAFDVLGVDYMEKGGEGSKGGKIIGHTKSGKPVYEKAGSLHDYNFNRKEHDEAASLHKKKSHELKEEAKKMPSGLERGKKEKEAQHHFDEGTLHEGYHVSESKEKKKGPANFGTKNKPSHED